MKMETMCSFETLVYPYKSMRRYIPEGHHQHNTKYLLHYPHNLVFITIVFFWG